MTGWINTSTLPAQIEEHSGECLWGSSYTLYSFTAVPPDVIALSDCVRSNVPNVIWSTAEGSVDQEVSSRSSCDRRFRSSTYEYTGSGLCRPGLPL